MTLDGGGGDVFSSVGHVGTEPSCSSDMWMFICGLASWIRQFTGIYYSHY